MAVSHHKNKAGHEVKLEILNSGTIAVSGKLPARAASTLYLSREQLPELAKLILRELAPSGELKNCEPLVLYFGSAEDREYMKNACAVAMPNARAVEV